MSDLRNAKDVIPEITRQPRNTKSNLHPLQSPVGGDTNRHTSGYQVTYGLNRTGHSLQIDPVSLLFHTQVAVQYVDRQRATQISLEHLPHDSIGKTGRSSGDLFRGYLETGFIEQEGDNFVSDGLRIHQNAIAVENNQVIGRHSIRYAPII
jgi:hypothetical protein